MKKIILVFLTVFFANLAIAQPPSGNANVGDTYGAKVDRMNAIPVNELPAMFKGKDTIAAKVMGKVLDVCSSKGCWLTMQVNDSTKAFVKMKGYAFFVPSALSGKTVVLDGIAFTKTTSVAELKHYAEDAKKPQQEIDAITAPKKEIRLLANGIVVVQ
ncbi:MAG: DUF4920 domain-containing protein [Bacteroidia bacterium]|nr:DUF4920 domain-containing protein [Bacteroidia bacterium]